MQVSALRDTRGNAVFLIIKYVYAEMCYIGSQDEGRFRTHMQCLENSNWQQLLHIFSDSLRDLSPKYIGYTIKVLKIEKGLSWTRRENLCPVPFDRVLLMQLGSDGPTAIGIGTINSRNNMTWGLNVRFESSKVYGLMKDGIRGMKNLHRIPDLQQLPLAAMHARYADFTIKYRFDSADN